MSSLFGGSIILISRNLAVHFEPQPFTEGRSVYNDHTYQVAIEFPEGCGHVNRFKLPPYTHTVRFLLIIPGR